MLRLIAKNTLEFKKFLSESNGYGCEITKNYHQPNASEKLKYEQILMHFLAAYLYLRSLENTSESEFKIILEMDLEESNNARIFAGAKRSNTFFSQQNLVRHDLVKK